MPTLHSPAMRTVDVARRCGYSVQQIRNLERDGVLPPTTRTAAGHRVHGEIHLHAALAYRALAVGTGPVEAGRIVRAAHTRPVPELLALLDAAHAGLHREREDLGLARRAARAISAEPLDDVRPSDAMSVSELAAALGVRPSTLRHWDAEGLVVPDRLPPRGTRRYAPAHIRDARIVHQLRAAGYRVEPLRALLPRLRQGHRWPDVEAALAARDTHLAARSRALLDAAAPLGALLTAPRQAPRPPAAPPVTSRRSTARPSPS
ncbi:MerR family transcriptional regulator [Streptomyces corynorhini]|uniref:MerR family transcriptional regulator n=1 Tax=Streptomyces corynorhini TaxID=2282652 RepID=A0A370B723_9ACTN|nr:MerR family transcriptional regulator [Streptomyces corynorhini]RDG35643.1 MerR family transcriptional regulator [Streptomyces corynorhini]